METKTKNGNEIGKKINQVFIYLNKSKNDKFYLSFKIIYNDGYESVTGFLNYNSAIKLFVSAVPNILLQFNPKSKHVILNGEIFETKKMRNGFYVSFVEYDNAEADTILQELYSEIMKDNEVNITETENETETEVEPENESQEIINENLPF
jgi:hypothetical protein